jgi:hypothetical protein
MTDSAVERGMPSQEDEEALVARIAADRRAGKDTSKDVEKLLRLAGEKNRAALDRLAK